jgi:hypothetical protein
MQPRAEQQKFREAKAFTFALALAAQKQPEVRSGYL